MTKSKLTAVVLMVISILTFTISTQAAEANIDAQKFIELEKKLAAASLEPQEYYDIDKVYNSYSIEDLKALYPNLNVNDVIKGMGYQIPQKVIIADKLMAQKSAAYFAPKHLEDLKRYAKIKFLLDVSQMLNDEFQSVIVEFNAVAYGIEGSKSDKKKAIDIIKRKMPDYLGELYIQKYFQTASN